MSTRWCVTLCHIFASINLASALSAKDRIPETINYSTPERYMRIPASAGNQMMIESITASLKDRDTERTLQNIHVYIAEKIPHVPDLRWQNNQRPFEQMLVGFDHDGCASHGFVFATLARACHIPVVYIKSFRHSWIKQYVATRERGSFSGHVFLEVYIDEDWKLLDAQGMRIWDKYDVNDHELPGSFLCYEKGWDHKAMVHSTQKDLFIAEALQRWMDFDVTSLKPNSVRGRSLLRRYFALTRGQEWKPLSERISNLNSFDQHHWPEFRNKVKGQMLIITAIGGKVALPPDQAPHYLPMDLKEIEGRSYQGESGIHLRQLQDGTTVILMIAPGWKEMIRLYWQTNFEVLQVSGNFSPVDDIILQ